MMIGYEPLEIIVTQEATYFRFLYMNELRRIFTDGRQRPAKTAPSFVGYSIGKWSDRNGDGKISPHEYERWAHNHANQLAKEDHARKAVQDAQALLRNNVAKNTKTAQQQAAAIVRIERSLKSVSRNKDFASLEGTLKAEAAVPDVPEQQLRRHGAVGAAAGRESRDVGERVRGKRLAQARDPAVGERWHVDDAVIDNDPEARLAVDEVTRELHSLPLMPNAAES